MTHRVSILIIVDLEVDETVVFNGKIGDPKPLASRGDGAAPAAGAGTGDAAMTGGEFYGAKKEESKAQPMQSIASRPATHAGSNIYPIEGLSPYSHKWTIKARVSVKSDIKTWHKPSGEGKLFSVNLLDESGEIKATGFNAECDAFYDLLQEGSVYYISTPCKVSMAKKQFSTLPNLYEMTFMQDTQIEKAEDQSSVPQVRFNFCTIQELQDVEKDNTVDVIGVLSEVAAVDTIKSKKDGREFEKRDLTILDDTGIAVRVTVWGKTAKGFDTELGSVIAFKGTKVSDFGGKSLSLLSSGTMSVDPDIPDAHRLKGWYDSAGRNNTLGKPQNLSTMGGATGRKDPIKTIAQVVDEKLGEGEVTSYYSIHASIIFSRTENFCYPACANEGCNKKVTDMNDGTWNCEKCNTTHEKPDYRYILSINVADYTSHQWVTCFDEQARSIIGLSANELMDYRDNDESKFPAAFEAIKCKKFAFRCRAKTDTFSDQAR